MAFPTEIVTFAISFIVGVAGAATYLLFVLMADKKLEILENKYLNLGLMTFFYIILGGIVAGIFFTSTGNPMEATSLQNVFMLGFGWQGAITGVGAAGGVKAGRDDIGESLDALLPPEIS